MYYRHPRGDKSGQEVVLRRGGRWLIRHDLAGHDDEDE